MKSDPDDHRTLSTRMRAALRLLAEPGAFHTCTSIGAALTGRRSSHGWQTSAREGGRTLHALKRRGLARPLGFDSLHQLWPWAITPHGGWMARCLGLGDPPARETEGRRTEAPADCPHCGEPSDEGDFGSIALHGRPTCPSCGREGCGHCMPAGRGVCCPGCEQGRTSDPD
jgi:hypothetical protein